VAQVKPLHCTKCNDIVRLVGFTRACGCNASGGQYENDQLVRVWGPCRIIGIDNRNFKREPKGTWFLIPDEPGRVERYEKT
jgi:hypothetical protein